MTLAPRESSLMKNLGVSLRRVEASSRALCCSIHSVFETSDASSDGLRGAESKLRRISGIKDSHTVFQMLDILLARVGGRSQSIQLVHYYRDHKLAKLEDIRPLQWIGRHASPYRLDQEWTVMVLIDPLVFTINDLFGHSKWVASTEWLSEGHKLVNNAPK